MMNATILATVSGILALGIPLAAAAGPQPAPIEKVEIRPDRAILVNGNPFFPLMAWLQDAGNFPVVRQCGMNTTAGYWSGSSGTKDAAEYQALVEKAGLYSVMPFDARLKGRPGLLGYIHEDEPDLPHAVNDAIIEPGKDLRINSKTPLWRLLDGDLTSWSVLDPLEGAFLTIKLPKPVTVESLAVAATVSKGLSTPKEVSFETGGAEIFKATLAAKPGRQKFDLPKPATFQELKLKVLSVTPGEQVWGSLGEIEGFDKDGNNVLLCPPRQVPRATPEQTMKKYKDMKAADPSRPVFLTLTGHFHPIFKKWNDEQRKMYPQYVRATDVVGYDIYPIYGWNKPEWIYLVHDATDLLVRLADGRPVYAWIETSKGGQWTGPLEKQKDVTPEHIRAEVWMSICRGATAIGYFTHVWKPGYAQFGVPEANRRSLQKINDQITRLTPAILGEPSRRAVSVEAEGGAKIDVMGKEALGALYLFAVNYDETMKQAKATIRVKDLQAGTSIAVVDEDRSIQAGDGAFADTFAPLAVHVYSLGP